MCIRDRTVTREANYSQTAASHDGADWGNTYVEVDLTNQYLYLFVNGAIVTQGPIVTGKPSRGDATPQGVYILKYKEKDTTLRGTKKDCLLYTSGSCSKENRRSCSN